MQFLSKVQVTVSTVSICLILLQSATAHPLSRRFSSSASEPQHFISFAPDSDTDSDWNSVDVDIDTPEIELPVPPPLPRRQQKNSAEDVEMDPYDSSSIMKHMNYVDDLTSDATRPRAILIRIRRSEYPKNFPGESYTYETETVGAKTASKSQFCGIKPHPRQPRNTRLNKELQKTQQNNMQPNAQKQEPVPSNGENHGKHQHYFNHPNSFHSHRTPRLS